MSVPKHIYLGNILGATGPIGPSGPAGIGCPYCSTLKINEWTQSGASLNLFSNSVDFDPFCWATGEGVTINGRNENGSPSSEYLNVDLIDQSTKKITVNNLINNYHLNYPITICHGYNIGPTGPSNGPIGETGPIGPSGLRGEDCKGCFGVSTTNLDLSSPATAIGERVTIIVEKGLSCLEGTRIRVHDRVYDSDSFLEGPVYSYENDKLIFTVHYKNGISNSSHWNFMIAGVVGATGPIGLSGPEMALSAEDRQIVYSNLGRPKGANLFYKILYNVAGEEVNRLGILISEPEETLDISGSLKIRNVEPISWPYN